MHCYYFQFCRNFCQGGISQQDLVQAIKKQGPEFKYTQSERQQCLGFCLFALFCFVLVWNFYFGWKGLIYCKQNTCTLKARSCKNPQTKPNLNFGRTKKLGEDTGKRSNHIINISLAPRWFLDL